MRTLTRITIAGAITASAAFAPAGVATAATTSESDDMTVTTYGGAWADFAACKADMFLPWCPR